jgi:hypothetical protein
MESSRRLLRASPALVLLAPLLVPLALPLASLPPGLVFALTSGRWLIVLGAAAAAFALARPPEPLPRHPERSEGSRDSLVLRPKALFVGTWLCGFSLFLALVPSHRWSGASLTGDEPKYLRMAESLYHDLDVDMGSDTQQDLDLRRLRRNVTSLLRATGSAVAGLFASGEGQGQAHSVGHNWTVEGRQGGRYYVQSPGLPIVLLPAVLLQRTLFPGSSGLWLPMLTLAALWSTALAHTVRHCVETGASPRSALLASAVLLSPPALIGGMHFYPEAAALPVLAWAIRFVRPREPELRWPTTVALATAIGVLPWLHPKLIPLALVLGLLLVGRVRRTPRLLAATLAAGLLPILTLLLFDHHVTGLLRPDALYVVYGSEVYAGLGSFVSVRLLTGFVNALFAAREGLFVMAPLALAGALAAPTLWRRNRDASLAIAAAFAAIWFVAAIHEGGAPGPPARLMTPAFTLLAVPLGIGVQELRRLPFRWTAAALALITISLTWSFRTDWLRTTNPYRGLPPEANFAPDLPDGPRDLQASPPEARRLPDLLRGLLLAGALALWSTVLTRRPSDPSSSSGLLSPWPQIRNTHLAWWSTLAFLSLCLHSLNP